MDKPLVHVFCQYDSKLAIVYVNLSKTNNMQIITACQKQFGFRLRSELIAIRTKKSETSV